MLALAKTVSILVTFIMLASYPGLLDSHVFQHRREKIGNAWSTWWCNRTLFEVRLCISTHSPLPLVMWRLIFLAYVEKHRVLVYLMLGFLNGARHVKSLPLDVPHDEFYQAPLFFCVDHWKAGRSLGMRLASATFVLFHWCVPEAPWACLRHSSY